MKKVYLLVYNDALGDRELIKSWANVSERVITWRYDLPHCFYLVSEATAAELSDDLKRLLDTTGRFLVTELSVNREGWLPADTWYFFQNKKVKHK